MYGSVDKSVRVWDVVTGACVQTLDGHSEGLRDLGELHRHGESYMYMCRVWEWGRHSACVGCGDGEHVYRHLKGTAKA